MEMEGGELGRGGGGRGRRCRGNGRGKCTEVTNGRAGYDGIPQYMEKQGGDREGRAPEGRGGGLILCQFY
jgi:hypothetical protein